VSEAPLSTPDRHEALFVELVAAARNLGIEVRMEAFRQAGPVSCALCRLRGRDVVLLDRGAPSYERAHAMASVLSRFEHAPIALGSAAWLLVRRTQLSRIQLNRAPAPRVQVIELLEPPIPRRRGKPSIRPCKSGIERPRAVPPLGSRQAPASRRRVRHLT